MRWYSHRERLVLKIIKQKEWHEWYAWYPVRLTNKKNVSQTVWLEKVYRKLECSTLSGRDFTDYTEYQLAVYIRQHKISQWYSYKELTDIMLDI